MDDLRPVLRIYRVDVAGQNCVDTVTQNNEEVQVAGMPNKPLAQSKLVRMILSKGEALAQLDHDANCQFLASA
jgi:hypothetical protein